MARFQSWIFDDSVEVFCEKPRGPMARDLKAQWHDEAVDRATRTRLSERARPQTGLTVADDDDWMRYFGLTPDTADDPAEPWIRAMTIVVSDHEELVVSWDLVLASVQVRYLNRRREVSSWVAEEARLLTGWANPGGRGVVVEYGTERLAGRLVVWVRPAFALHDSLLLHS